MSSYGNYSESLISKIIFLTHYGRGHSYDFVHSHKKEWVGVNKNSFFKIILSSHGFRDAVYYWSNIDPLMMQVRINWIWKESNEVLVTLLLPYLIYVSVWAFALRLHKLWNQIFFKSKKV